MESPVRINYKPLHPLARQFPVWTGITSVVGAEVLYPRLKSILPLFISAVLL